MISNKYRLIVCSALMAVVCTGIYMLNKSDIAQEIHTFAEELSVDYILPVNCYMDHIDTDMNYDLKRTVLYDIYPSGKYFSDNFNIDIGENGSTLLGGILNHDHYSLDGAESIRTDTDAAGVRTAAQNQNGDVLMGQSGGTVSETASGGSAAAGNVTGTAGDTVAATANAEGISTAGSENENVSAASANAAQINNSVLTGVITRNGMTGSVYSRADLNDYNFTHKNFYTVTSITSLTSDILRPAEFLDKDMRVSCDAAQPQILIFHTHSQETFADSVEGDTSTTIVGVGDYLTELLTARGYNVIHDRSVYDYVDGKLDRSKAYTYAENGIAEILDANPSIDVVIDLHRDGVADTTHLLTEVDGKQMAKIMFFNGLSYSNVNGSIGYLYNPYRDDNLAMSLQMQLLGEAYYPGFLRNIYINAYRYCLHERGKSMLIEAGAQTNTVQEVKNAMEPLSDLLDKLLKGEKAF